MKNISTSVITKNATTPIPQQWSQNGHLKLITAFDPVFLSIVFFIAVVGNLYLVISIIYDKRLHTSINLPLMLQCITSTCLSLSTMLPAILALIISNWTIGKTFCHLNAFSYRMLSFYAFANLATISIDRWRTFTNNKYQLSMQRVVSSQLSLFVISSTIALPWPTFLGDANVAITFSAGYLKCSSVTKDYRSSIIHTTETICRLLSQIAPLATILFCSARVFKRIKQRYNCVAPAVISTENGYPIGCYLKSALTNLLLITCFVILRSPELTAISLEDINAVHNGIYGKRLLAYLTWIQCAIHPIICIARNTKLLHKIASSCCCGKLNLFHSRSERRRKQYEVQQEFTQICFSVSENSLNSDSRSSSSILNFEIPKKDAWHVNTIAGN